MKRVLSALFFLLISMSVQAKSPSFYEYLNSSFLRSSDVIQEKKEESSLSSHEEEKKVKKKPIKIEYHSLEAIQQKVMFTDLLSLSDPDLTFGDVLNKNGIEELDLIDKGSDEVSLIRQIAPRTVFGDVMLATMLSRPLVSVHDIEQRQAFVRSCVENDDVYDRLNQALEKVRSGQEYFFSFFDKKNNVEQELLKSLYFGKWLNKLNKSAIALSLKRTKANVGSCVRFVAFSFLAKTGANITGELMSNESRNKKIFNCLTKAPFYGFCNAVRGLIASNNPIRSAVSLDFDPTVLDLSYKMQAQQSSRTVGDGYYDAMEMHRKMNSPMKDYPKTVAGLVVLPTVFADLNFLWGLSSLRNRVNVEKPMLVNMQQRLIGVATLMQGLREIYELTEEYPQLVERVGSLRNIVKLFESSNAEIKKLLNALDTWTFSGNPSYVFSNTVRVLIAFKRMTELRGEFTNVLKAAGEVDALYAASTLVKDKERGNFCFAQIINRDVPCVELKNFWNPLMKPELAIYNTISLGSGVNSNMMLTGPNGSGKSTNMKAIALNIIFAQTLGIAAADQMVLSPFDKVNTYLNVRENLSEGLSTFMAEAKRLEQVVSSISSFSAHKKCFTIMDEGLKGTVAEEAVIRLTDAVEKLVANPASMSVVATHFEKPTELQEKTGRIANYFVPIEELALGQFKRTFKLEKGVNLWWFQDAGKRKRFVDWLINKK